MLDIVSERRPNLFYSSMHGFVALLVAFAMIVRLQPILQISQRNKAAFALYVEYQSSVTTKQQVLHPVYL